MFLWSNSSELEYNLVAIKNSLCRRKVFTEIKWLKTSKGWPRYQVLDPGLGLWCSRKYEVDH